MTVVNEVVSPYVYVGVKGHLQVPSSALTKEAKIAMAKAIINAVIKYYKISSKEELMKKKRKLELVIPRHIAAHLIRRKTMLQDSEIAKEFFNGRDRTTILHSINLIQDYIDSKNEEIINDIKNIQKLI